MRIKGWRARISPSPAGWPCPSEKDSGITLKGSDSFRGYGDPEFHLWVISPRNTLVTINRHLIINYSQRYVYQQTPLMSIQETFCPHWPLPKGRVSCIFV